MESLTEVFKCFICLGKLKVAHLCPHCSKLCCYSCIRRWLETSQRSQCPHCQVTLRLGNLVNCRWAECVIEQLDTFQQDEKNEKKELCVTHNKKLSVFCLNCEKCICHQCALWDKMHSNHDFKPLEEVCLQYKEKVDEVLIHLRKRHSEIKGVITEIEKNVKDLTNAKDDLVNEIKNSVSQRISSLEKQLREKLSSLKSQKNVWSEECDAIQSILDSSEKELKTCSKSELLLRSKRTMQIIFKLKSQPITNLNLYAIDVEYPREIIPPYESGIFVLYNFSSLKSKVVPVYSPPLRTSGLIWMLKVFPAGNGIESWKYLSVHFELSSGSTETLRYQYRVEMIHQEFGDPSKARVEEFASEFNVGECWGFNRFYPLDELVSGGYLKDDTLVLKFGVRSLSYYQKCKVQEWYIKQLEIKNNVPYLP